MKMKMKMTKEQMRLILIELPKGEMILREQPTKEVGEIVYRMYQMLNIRLSVMCQELKYPMEQNKWEDAKPLIEMNKIFPNLLATDWYQNQLMMMLNPTKPPKALRIPIYEK